MQHVTREYKSGGNWVVTQSEMKFIDLIIDPVSVIRYRDMWKNLPNKLGLGNLHDSLYVEYCGWEYGLPEKSPPERTKQETDC